MPVDTVVDGVDIRAVVPEGKDPIRTRIVERALEIAETIPFDIDVPDGALLFDIVKRGNLDDISERETPALAIEEGQEQIDPLIYLKTDKKLRLYFHLKVVKVMGIDPEPAINYYFHRIVQTFVTTRGHFSDADGNELARDIAEVGNSIEKFGSSDSEPGGSIWLDIDYRHERGDWIHE